MVTVDASVHPGTAVVVQAFPASPRASSGGSTRETNLCIQDAPNRTVDCSPGITALALFGASLGGARTLLAAQATTHFQPKFEHANGTPQTLANVSWAEGLKQRVLLSHSGMLLQRAGVLVEDNLAFASLKRRNRSGRSGSSAISPLSWMPIRVDAIGGRRQIILLALPPRSAIGITCWVAMGVASSTAA